MAAAGTRGRLQCPRLVICVPPVGVVIFDAALGRLAADVAPRRRTLRRNDEPLVQARLRHGGLVVVLDVEHPVHAAGAGPVESRGRLLGVNTGVTVLAGPVPVRTRAKGLMMCTRILEAQWSRQALCSQRAP